MQAVQIMEDEDLPQSGSFEIYRSEGENLRLNGDYKKAIECFSLALEFRPGNEDCLVSRAKCHLMQGNVDLALEDAETCLQEIPESARAIYQKSEALYFKGNFEQALVFYHRGRRLCPASEDFRLGIQKAREAISNAVGNPEVIHLNKTGDLSYFDNLANEAAEAKKRKPSAGFGRKQKQVEQPRRTLEEIKKDRTLKEVLGELYGDRLYLEKLYNDPISLTGQEPIQPIVEDGIKYLDGRSEFWRQQQPTISPRTKEKQRRTKNHIYKDPTFVMREMDTLDKMVQQEKNKEALKRAKRLLESSEVWSYSLNKDELLGSIFSYIGQAHMQNDNIPEAIEAFQRDQKISKDAKLVEGQLRALSNIGRAFTMQGDYPASVPYWKQAISLSSSGYDSTFLYHELGRCHLEIGELEKAEACGRKSVDLAVRFEDLQWQLNAKVLVGQALIKLKKLADALKVFKEAKILARKLKDPAAVSAIERAIKNLQMQMELIEEEAKQKSSEETITEEEDEKHVVKGQKKQKEQDKKHKHLEPSPRAKSAGKQRPSSAELSLAKLNAESSQRASVMWIDQFVSDTIDTALKETAQEDAE